MVALMVKELSQIGYWNMGSIARRGWFVSNFGVGSNPGSCPSESRELDYSENAFGADGKLVAPESQLCWDN